MGRSAMGREHLAMIAGEGFTRDAPHPTRCPKCKITRGVGDQLCWHCTSAMKRRKRNMENKQ